MRAFCAGPGRRINIILAPTHHHAARCHLFMRLAYTSGLAAFMHYHLPDRTPHSMSVISLWSNFSWNKKVIRTIVFLSSLLYAVSANDVYCNGSIYGNPHMTDCTKALSRFPKDHALRYFVDQEMRSSTNLLNWQKIDDPRPIYEHVSMVQIPQRISEGKMLHQGCGGIQL